MGWVFRLSGDKQIGAIALPLPMLHHDDRQAALHLQDESEHTMGQGTLSSEAVCSFRIHFCFWDSIACLRPLGGRLISLLLYAFVLGRFTVWFCVVGLVAPRPKGSISRKGCWLIHGECAQCGGKLRGNGNACHHLLGWTLAEELLTMLLKEWSGKKDLPKTCHPTPKEGKVFQSSAILTLLWTGAFLRWSDSHPHTNTWHHCTQTNAREGESNLRIFTYHESWGMNHVCIYFQHFLDSAFLPLWYGLANASFGPSICIDAVGPPHPTFRCCWMFPGVRQVVPSGPQSLRGPMPSLKSMDERVDGWCCTVCLTWLSCTGYGSFWDCGNLCLLG